jgi:selenide,water dikinase
MNPPTSTAPIEKTVVLVGAGNAHLVFARRWGMRPIPGVAVTLVNESSVIPYSAMVPGHIAGDFSWEQITIDLVRLCQAVKIRLVAKPVTAIDTARRQVCFTGRPPLTYDALSLGLGSIPACPPALPPSAENGVMTPVPLVMRPLGALVEKLDALDASLALPPRKGQPFHLVVVGGGASGCELALTFHKRLAKHPGFRLTLLQGNSQLLPEFPGGAARAFEKVFQEREIAFRVDARVTGTEPGAVVLHGGERIVCDAVLWATQASPPPLLAATGLAVDPNGFLQVHDTLQSVSDPAVFGTGDCVAFRAYPELPRNGVYAVRQGAVLFDNVGAFLREMPLQPFRPQRWCLCLLNTADGRAVLNYGPLTWKSRWARKLKDRIDRAWIMKFTRFAPMPEAAPGAGSGSDGSTMRCGGCGSKISSDVLSAVLRRLDVPEDPRVLLGTRAGEDAAVHRVRPELFGSEPDKLLEVQTVDYFKAFLDDPYLFGRIAALNAVSDLYAMNARPFTALAIATLPYARGPVQEGQLYELLCGALDSFRELGVVLTGGHTTEGNELALGFAVTGFAEEGRLFQKSNLRPGDVLILTKPLGTGAVLAAWMRSECKATWFDKLVASMLLSNKAAGKVFCQAGVTACTDVTGFGLAGHLLEMLDASRVSCRLNAKAVPLYDGFEEVVSRGIVSSLQRDNAKAACRVHASSPVPEWLFDPQTSGGLLAGVQPERVLPALECLREAGYESAAVIGEIVALAADDAPLIHLE